MPATYAIVPAGSVNNPVIGVHTAVFTLNVMLQLLIDPTSPPASSTTNKFQLPFGLPENDDIAGVACVIEPGPGAIHVSVAPIFVGA